MLGFEGGLGHLYRWYGGSPRWSDTPIGVVGWTSEVVLTTYRSGTASLRGGTLGFGTESPRRWTYLEGLCNVSDGVMRWSDTPIEVVG